MRLKAALITMLIFVMGILVTIGGVRLAQNSQHPQKNPVVRIINAFVGNTPLAPPAQIPLGQTNDGLAAVIALAKSTYVKIDIHGVIMSDKQGGGSGVRIGDNLILSCFHLLQPHTVTLLGNEVLDIQSIDPPNDLALFITDQKKHVKVKLASSVTLGEQLIGYSNAGGKDGFLRTYFVAKVDDAHGLIYLDHAAFPGESGSGLFNLKGELVGIVDAFEFVTVGESQIPTDGVAVSYTAIAKFLKNLQQ